MFERDKGHVSRSNFYALASSASSPSLHHHSCPPLLSFFLLDADDFYLHIGDFTGALYLCYPSYLPPHAFQALDVPFPLLLHRRLLCSMLWLGLFVSFSGEGFVDRQRIDDGFCQQHPRPHLFSFYICGSANADVKQGNDILFLAVPVAVIASFKKMKKLTNHKSLIVVALKESYLLTLRSNEKKVKRVHPFPLTEAFDPELCTVLVENLPEDHIIEILKKIFGEAGLCLITTNVKRLDESEARHQQELAQI
ncbi:hypothetical protein LXL04_019438 [Taraxacum kok-saghyz]